MYKKNPVPIPLIAFGVVLVLSVVALAVIPGLQSAREVDPADIASPDDVPRVTVAEAYTAVMNGEAVLVDTRSAAQFSTGHAAGAINIPDGQTEALIGDLDPNTWIITYCT